MANAFDTFKTIVEGSKQFSFDGSVLTLTGYYTGGSVRLDLSKITPEMFEELTAPQTFSIYYDEEEDSWQVWDEEGNELYEEFLTKEGAIQYCEDRDSEYIYA